MVLWRPFEVPVRPPTYYMIQDEMEHEKTRPDGYGEEAVGEPIGLYMRRVLC
jgi:hypothetical protein